jgi:hypothetical protein
LSLLLLAALTMERKRRRRREKGQEQRVRGLMKMQEGCRRRLWKFGEFLALWLLLVLGLGLLLVLMLVRQRLMRMPLQGWIQRQLKVMLRE